MKTFAHTESGQAVDPAPATDAAEYISRFSTEITASWSVEEVPNGTQHGATPDGQGGWINPSDPVPVLQYSMLSGSGFEAYSVATLAAVNGTDAATALARMGEIIRGVRLAATNVDGKIEIAYQRYTAAMSPGGKFAASDVADFAATLGAAGMCAPDEATALAGLAAWPKR